MKPYDDKGEKKGQVETMFDAIAPRYDLLNHTLSLGIDRGWRRRMVREVRRSGATELLDAATGTADVAIMLARKCPGARVRGVDLSAGMLEIGRRKVAGAGLSGRIVLEQGDAEALPYADGAFDAVTVAFGVRNFGDIPRGLAELFRVLRPGGSLWVLEFGIPKHKIFGALYRFYFHRVLPLLGGWVSRDRRAYVYLPRSVDDFPYGEGFAALLREAGFAGGNPRNLFGGVAQLYYAKKER